MSATPGPGQPQPPPLAPGQGGIAISLPPEVRPSGLTRLVLQVDGERVPYTRDATFLPVRAGQRTLTLHQDTGLGRWHMFRVALEVPPGQWRRLAVRWRRPRFRVYDEHGTDLNTVNPYAPARILLWLLVTVILCGIVIAFPFVVGRLS